MEVRNRLFAFLLRIDICVDLQVSVLMKRLPLKPIIGV